MRDFRPGHACCSAFLPCRCQAAFQARYLLLQLTCPVLVPLLAAPQLLELHNRIVHFVLHGQRH